MTAVPELIGKLARATGALDDDTLAEVIACALGETPVDHWIECGDGGEDFFRLDTKEQDGVYAYGQSRSCCPDVSLDAALALVERGLPHANTITLEKQPAHGKSAGGWEVTLARNFVGDGHWAAIGWGQSAPLAVMQALLSALYMHRLLP